jgi:hypothetical protein
LLKEGLNLREIPEKHASGAEARVDFVRFNAGDESPAYRPDEFFSKL